MTRRGWSANTGMDAALGCGRVESPGIAIVVRQQAAFNLFDSLDAPENHSLLLLFRVACSNFCSSSGAVSDGQWWV